MKVFNIKICTYIKTVVSFIFGMVFRLFRKKSKLKTGDEDIKPIKIQIDYGDSALFPGIEQRPSMLNHSSRYQGLKDQSEKVVDWSEWNDKFDQPSDPVPAENEAESLDVELFKDMEPVISKPKVVRLKQNTTHNADVAKSLNDNDKFRIDGSGVNIQSELGAWVDEPVGWDEEEIDDNEITRESSRLMKEKKRLEREQRAQEQLRRKQEKDAIRHQKRVTGQLGVKIN